MRSGRGAAFFAENRNYPRLILLEKGMDKRPTGM